MIDFSPSPLVSWTGDLGWWWDFITLQLSMQQGSPAWVRLKVHLVTKRCHSKQLKQANFCRAYSYLIFQWRVVSRKAREGGWLGLLSPVLPCDRLLFPACRQQSHVYTHMKSYAAWQSLCLFSLHSYMSCTHAFFSANCEAATKATKRYLLEFTRKLYTRKKEKRSYTSKKAAIVKSLTLSHASFVKRYMLQYKLQTRFV